MFRKLIFLAIVEFLILDQTSYVLSRQLNFTQFKNLFKPELYHQTLRDVPVERDVSYLSDEAYDVENSDELKQLIKRSRDYSDKYQHLCKIQKRLVNIKEDGYEYQPSSYYETYCQSSYEGDNAQVQQKCAHPGFHCVQRTQRVTFVRRPWASDCWELHTRDVASGCDCMWPVTTLGKILDHY